MKKIIFVSTLAILSSYLISRLSANNYPVVAATTDTLFKVQSVDTMKYSRDVAREKIKDSSFNETIEKQISEIKDTGATHVAIATPYDEEFVPFLKRWVQLARKYDLKVWFRGNMAGWEGWFEYKKITKEEHTKLITNFIYKYPELFEVGDIFTSCPECENGGPGDPRNTKDVSGFRSFLIDEYNKSSEAFSKINKQVTVGYYSMNGDVARLIMDPKTTKALGGIVTVDHYVKTPEKLISDVRDFAKRSEGNVVLGEWGAPIPDINGAMTDEEQSAWISEALSGLSKVPELVGVNYWTGRGSSTALWKSQSNQSLSSKSLTNYFKLQVISAKVTDEIGRNIEGAKVESEPFMTSTSWDGSFSVKTLPKSNNLLLSANGYQSKTIRINEVSKPVVLIKENPSFFYKTLKFINSILQTN